MRIIEELEPGKNTRKTRHTLVQGSDKRFYKVLTFQLYDMEPGPEFARFEVNVQCVNENGTFSALVVPHYKRFMTLKEAMDYHQKLLDSFEEVLGIKEVKAH